MSEIEQTASRALGHHRAGEFQAAEPLYRSALALEPRHGDVNHNLGVLLIQTGQPQAALPYLKEAVEINPLKGRYWLSYAEGLIAADRAQDALVLLDEGRQRGLQGAEADALRQRTLAVLGSAPGPTEMSGLAALFSAGRQAEAEALARRMIQSRPDHAYAWKALGAALAGQKRFAEAASVLEKAVSLPPPDPETLRNLGVVLTELGRLTQAEAAFRRAADIKPDYHEAHNSLANALKALGRLDEAVASYRRAVAIQPDFAGAHTNLGNALCDLGRLLEGVACHRRAIAIGPGLAMAHNNLANALKDLGMPEEALASYRRALAIEPDDAVAHSNLIFSLNYLSGAPATLVLNEARNYGERIAARARPYTAWPGSADRSRRLRVGIVSGDLRDHPVSLFLEGFLAEIPHEQLALFAYPTVPMADATTRRLQPLFAGWKAVAAMNDEDFARTVHDDAIDILIDMSGHSANNRLPVFAWKPAPVQVTWMGNLATTGVPGIDYVLGDPWVTPPEDAAHFTETVWRMPETIYCYTPPAAESGVAPLPAPRNGFLTFGSFNNLPKMNDAVVALWARVLHAVPDSKLLLKTRALAEAEVRERTAARFAALGIAAERLALEPSAARAEMLRSYDRVDIALDPFPHPGVTTTVEALWMGVPVLTRRGDRFLARSAEGFARNAGLPDWIAADDEEYVRLAVARAADLDQLSTLRAGLRARVLASPICDARRFAAHFAEAMRGMWRKWCDSR